MVRWMGGAISDPVTDTSGAQLQGARRLSLRARLILLVVVCMVPLITFTLSRRYVDYEDAVASSGKQTLELARSMSLAVAEELQTRIATLQVLALSQRLRDGDLAAFRDQAEAVVAEQFPGSNIILLREDGQQLMNTLVPRGAPLPVRPNLEATRHVFATRRPAVSGL